MITCCIYAYLGVGIHDTTIWRYLERDTSAAWLMDSPSISYPDFFKHILHGKTTYSFHISFFTYCGWLRNPLNQLLKFISVFLGFQASKFGGLWDFATIQFQYVQHDMYFTWFTVLLRWFTRARLFQVAIASGQPGPGIIHDHPQKVQFSSSLNETG